MGFYEVHGGDYTNPHEPALAEALSVALDEWRDQLGLPLRRVLDLACGSGEVGTMASEKSAWKPAGGLGSRNMIAPQCGIAPCKSL